MTSIELPDRPLGVRPPGAAPTAWLLVITLAVGATAVLLLAPQVGDLVTDVGLAGKAVPVAGAHADGRCTSHRGVLTECEATLTAPGRARKVHYFFVDLHTGDYQVRVLADPARPALLTTDLALDHLVNRVVTFVLAVPLFAGFVLGMTFLLGRAVRLQRATLRALSNQRLRPVLLRMTHYTLGQWVVSLDGRERSWAVPRRARPIVMDPARRLVLGVTAGDGAFALPLDRRLRWLGVDDRERRALLAAIGPDPVGPWLRALDTPAMAAERRRWRALARGLAIAGALFGVATACAWWARDAGELGLLVFALGLAVALGLLLGAALIARKAARYEALLR
jgi:hypothetical protein